MKKLLSIFPFTLLLLALVAAPALAKTETLTLTMMRTWGYSGFGNDIQGHFTLTATGPNNLQSVQFLLDGEVVLEDTEAPFNYQLNTDNFDNGLHTLGAIGTLSDGSQISSNEFVREFVAAKDLPGLIGPILALAAVVTVLMRVGPMLLNRGKPQTRAIGEYGMAGGAVCRQCQLPFSRSMMGLNLGLGKLERCPHCGQWQIARRANGDKLHEAEKRLKQDQQEGQLHTELSEEDRLRQELDSSRFDD